MPVLFRVLLLRFGALLLITSGAILGLLLSTRFYEIARFAALGGSGPSLVTFILCQILLVLPIVIPIGAALSSFFLMQELNRQGMVTSLRASALPFRVLFTPLLLTALFLSLLNGVLVWDVAPYSKQVIKGLQREWKGINPLALVKQKELLLASNIEIIPLGEADPSLFANQVIAAYRKPGQKRLLFLTLDHLERTEKEIKGDNLTAFVYGSKQPGGFADVYLDQSKTLSTELEPLSTLFSKEDQRIITDHLNLTGWIAEVKKGKLSEYSQSRLWAECFRRLMILLAPLTFTFLGAVSGCTIGRSESFRPKLILLLSTAFFMIAFFFGKSFDRQLALSIPCFLAPHLILVLAGLRRVSLLTRGIG